MAGKRITDEKMILALITCKDITTASEKLGISRQAIYNRLQQPTFRKRLQSERQGQYQVLVTLLCFA